MNAMLRRYAIAKNPTLPSQRVGRALRERERKKERGERRGEKKDLIAETNQRGVCMCKCVSTKVHALPSRYQSMTIPTEATFAENQNRAIRLRLVTSELESNDNFAFSSSPRDARCRFKLDQTQGCMYYVRDCCKGCLNELTHQIPCYIKSGKGIYDILKPQIRKRNQGGCVEATKTKHLPR
jgi:hypothetical protein